MMQSSPNIGGTVSCDMKSVAKAAAVDNGDIKGVIGTLAIELVW